MMPAYLIFILIKIKPNVNHSVKYFNIKVNRKNICNLRKVGLYTNIYYISVILDL